MKEGWTYKKLGELFPIVMGKTPSRSIAKYWDAKKETNNLWVSIADLSKYEGKEIYETKEYISDEGKQNIKLVPKGSLLVSFKLSLGKMAFAGEDLYTNEAIISLQKRKDIDLRFLYYYFSFLDWNKLTTGNEKVKGKTLNKSSLAEIPIVYIPLSEQRAIVSRLDSAFAQIDALNANAEKQLEEARKLFQAELTEAMKPKEGWEEKKLGEVCKSVNYGTSMPSSENGQFKYIRMNNITIDGTLNLDNLKTISVPDKELEKCLVKKGDLLFNRTNSPELVGKSCIFEEDEDMVIAGYIIRIRFNDTIYPSFANYFINLQRQLGNLRPLIVGAVHQANISAKAIQSINISFPNVETQHQIVSRLDALSANAKRLEELQQKTLAECDALKQAMLREVFE